MHRKGYGIKWVVLLALCFGQFVLSTHASVLPPDIQVSRFKGGVPAALSLTFDDGLPTHIENAIPILNEYGLRGTFFIHTDNVKEGTPSNWDAWRDVAQEGHEIASHSKTHLAMPLVKDKKILDNEIAGSKYLLENQTGAKVLSFAYPFSEENDYVRRLVLEEFQFDRSDCRVWGGPDFKLETAIQHINQVIENKAYDYVMLHGVGEPTWYSIDVGIYRQIVAYLAQLQDQIWTDTYANIRTYERKRNAAEIRYRNVTRNGFDFRLSLPDRPEFVGLPAMRLTAQIFTDGRDPSTVRCMIDSSEVPHSFSYDGHYLLVNVYPDGRWVHVKWE